MSDVASDSASDGNVAGDSGTEADGNVADGNVAGNALAMIVARIRVVFCYCQCDRPLEWLACGERFRS